MSVHKTITLECLADTLEKINAPDQGLRYHNGSPQRRFDTVTGKPYFTHDPTELSVFGDRANRIYEIINDGPNIAKLIRAALATKQEAST